MAQMAHYKALQAGHANELYSRRYQDDRCTTSRNLDLKLRLRLIFRPKLTRKDKDSQRNCALTPRWQTRWHKPISNNRNNRMGKYNPCRVRQ